MKFKEKISELNYKLKLPDTMRIHPVFQVSLPEPAPQTVKTQEEVTIEQETYEVETIAAEKESLGKKVTTSSNGKNTVPKKAPANILRTCGS